ncbi:MAG: hypothetical protein EXR71_11380 [Myxococcales bacterium]|nr:hypothetical protein [Myxococcales bacterium]
MAGDDKSLDQTTVLGWLRGRGHSGKDARTLLQHGKVWLQDVPVTNPHRPVGEGLRIISERPRFDARHEPAVIARDTHLCIVYKPSGLLSVPAPGRREPSVLRAVERWFGCALAVHRIDEGTSGLMMVALDEPTQLRLKAIFEAHDIERSYLALVAGAFPMNARTVRSHLVRDRGDGKRGSVAAATAESKTAVTHLRCISRFDAGSLVEARLETGRTHQVRIHLAESGHPILGDDIYGCSRGGRLALHAHILGFRHPWTGVMHRYVSPLPDDLAPLITAPPSGASRARARQR